MPYGNRYNFTNPGSDAGDALLEFLAKREAEKRQAMLDALAAKEQQARDEDRKTNREIQRENVEISRSQREAQAAKAKADRAAGIAKQLPQNSELDPETAKVLAEGGLSALIEQSGNGQGDLSGDTTQPPMNTAPHFRGTAEQQETAAQKKRLQQIVEDATLPKAVRDAARVEIATGQKIISGSMFENADQPVMKINPQTGKMEQIGTAPKGSHFVTEPAPKEHEDPSWQVVDTEDGLVQVNPKNGQMRPLTDPDGKPLKKGGASKGGGQAVPAVIDAIDELSRRINTNHGLLAKLSGGVEKAKAQANYNDDVAEYMSIVSGFTPLIARAVGHTGVLTEQDVQSVRALFPEPGDSESLRTRKINRIRSIMGRMNPSGTPPPHETPEQRLARLKKMAGK